MWDHLLELLFLEQTGGVIIQKRRRKRIVPSCSPLVILRLIYSAARKVITILHDATLGTIDLGVYLLRYGTQHQKERIHRVVALRHHCARRSS